MREDVLNNVVVQLGPVVIRVYFGGYTTSSHMLSMEVRLMGAELGRSMPLSELP